jgi:hypothetical protein
MQLKLGRSFELETGWRILPLYVFARGIGAAYISHRRGDGLTAFDRWKDIKEIEVRKQRTD